MKVRITTKSLRFWLLMYVAGALLYAFVYTGFRQAFYVHPALLLLGDTKVQQQGQELIRRVETAMESRGLPMELEVPAVWHLESGASGPSIVLGYVLRMQTGSPKADAVRGRIVLSTSDSNASKTLVRPVDATPGTETTEIDFSLPRFDELLAGRYLRESPDFAGCLYLSAVTISTLGTGDILPRSNIGRFLVVSEVLYGLVVLGILLHFVTQRVSSEQVTQPVKIQQEEQSGQQPPAPYSEPAPRSPQG